jgi:hypothetical protein
MAKIKEVKEEVKAVDPRQTFDNGYYARVIFLGPAIDTGVAWYPDENGMIDFTANNPNPDLKYPLKSVKVKIGAADPTIYYPTSGEPLSLDGEINTTKDINKVQTGMYCKSFIYKYQSANYTAESNDQGQILIPTKPA